jgi:pSer/pThr/pTyr-binding forkhead associated (FHA) protein
MFGELSIFDVSMGAARLLARLGGGDVIVGRSSDAGVPLVGDAVSFEHGILSKKADFWFFKDLRSTNGSWINGNPLKAERWYLVRGGDILQVGDAIVRLEEHGGGGPVLEGRLLVLAKDEFLREFPVLQEGLVLSVGGSRGDLPLPSAESSRASLIFDFRHGCLFAKGESGLLVGRKNGEEVVLPVELFDRDEIAIGDYHIFVQSTNQSGAQGKNEDRLSKDTWDGSDRTTSDGSSWVQRPRFGDAASGGDLENELLGTDAAELAARFIGTSAGGEGRPLAQDSLAFLPPPPPRPVPFLNTNEGRWVAVALIVLFVSAILISVLLFK